MEQYSNYVARVYLFRNYSNNDSFVRENIGEHDQICIAAKNELDVLKKQLLISRNAYKQTIITVTLVSGGISF